MSKVPEEEYKRLEKIVRNHYKDEVLCDKDVDTLVKSIYESNKIAIKQNRQIAIDYVPAYNFSTEIGKKNYWNMVYDLYKKDDGAILNSPEEVRDAYLGGCKVPMYDFMLKAEKEKKEKKKQKIINTLKAVAVCSFEVLYISGLIYIFYKFCSCIGFF